jgi:methyl-accepting chemotaxis protein
VLKSIRLRIVIGITLLICAFSVILGIASTIFSQKVIEQQYCRDYIKLNDATVKILIKTIEGFGSGISTVSENTNMKEIIEHPDFKPYTIDALKAFQVSNPDITLAYIGTEEGKVITYPELNIKLDPRTRSWYKDAKDSDSVVWTNPYVDAASGSVIITGAKAVHKDSQLIGVIGADLKLDYLNKIILEAKFSQTGVSYIVNKSTGTIITHNDKKLLGTPVDKDILTEINQNQNGSKIMYDKDHIKKILIYNYIKSLDSTLITEINYTEISQTTSAIKKVIIIFSLIITIILIFIAYMGSGKIVKYINLMRDEMKYLEQGDFSRKIKSIKRKDEIGQLSESFNLMVENIRKLIMSNQAVGNEVMEASENLLSTAEETNASAVEASHASREISAGAEKQTQEIQKTVTISNELSQSFDDLLKSSDLLNKEVENILIVNKQGINTLEELSVQSQKTKNSNIEVEQAIVKLDSSTETIYEILESIKAIAAQTNLLALNASIEAARAGEGGKGFSVVASEIRKLAEESDAATQNIGKILESTRYESKNTVSIMKNVKNIYNEQEKAVENVNIAFEKISNSIEESVSRIEETINKIDELRAREKAMKSIINSIDEISEETARSSEEVTAAMEYQVLAVESISKSAEALTNLVLNLRKRLSEFKLD